MTGWETAVRGLEWLLATPKAAVASALIVKENPEIRESVSTISRFYCESWRSSLGLMQESHVFEFDRDVSLLLSLTKNEVRPDVRLPSPLCFSIANST